MIKQRIAAAALAATLFGSVAVGTVSAQSNAGGAAGLIAAVVQLAVDDGVVTVNVVDSFNNLRALNNVLNNSPILSGNDVDVTVGDVSILSNFLNNNTITLEDFLNNNNVLLEDVVAIGILSTDDIIIFV
jgi:hypothetical protein